MRLTRAGEYAVRCVLFLAKKGKGEIVARRDIADGMDIPYQFLGKIGQKLAANGIIRIAQGAKGGFMLNHPPADITLLQVVEAIEGVIFLNDCIMYPSECHRSTGCAVHRVWDKARQGLRDTLAEVNFEELSGCGEGCEPRGDLAAGISTK